MRIMGKVRLKLTPSLTSIVNAPDSDWFILEKEMGEEATIGDLLIDLALSYTDFGKVVFDPDTGKVSDQVMVVLNDNLLQLTDLTEVKLSDGDCITLLPMYTGG